MADSPARLLIIDDEAALMQALCDTLQMEGYHATGFTSAKEALAKLQDEAFDVVLSDLMMPEMDGISVLNAAFQIDPALVGVIMTGHGSIDTAVNALKTGALDYILKPFKLTAVLPVLKRAVEVRRLRRENIELRETLALHELSTAIAVAQDYETVVERLADAAYAQSNPRSLSVFLNLDSTGPGESGLHVAAVRGSVSVDLKGLRVPLTAETQRCIDADSNAFRHYPGIPPGLSVPMRSGGNLVGILHFEPGKSNRISSPGQRRALSILAGTGASALAAASGLDRLRAAEERYRRLAEDAPDVVARFEVTPAFACSYINPIIAKVTGYSPEEFYANPELALNIVYLDDRPLARKALYGDLPHGSTVTLRWQRKGNSLVWMELRSARVNDSHGKLLAVEVVGRDVTERRDLEERLRHSQKLEAVGKLTAGVAHDFNNLLTVINGYCALVLQEIPTTSPAWQKLDEVKKAGDHAAGLTNQLLLFSRKQVSHPQPVHLPELLTSMDKMIRRVAGESVEVSVYQGPNIGDVKIDLTQAQQVILNLTVNAKDAMSAGGKLDFELTNTILSDGPDSRPSPYVRLQVSDTGCGMSPDVQQHIFEPFFTTKEVGRGTGLGLATVHGIVEQSGGRIQVDSKIGAGTVFTILLPQCGGSSVAATEPHATAAGGHETVLLVEDDPAVRALSREVLTRAGYAVLTAEDGAAAIRLAGIHGKNVDLLLTDLGLPGMAGTTVAERVRTLAPEIRVLFMSGHADTNPVAAAAIRDEKAAFLPKPFTPAELLAKVRATVSVTGYSIT